MDGFLLSMVLVLALATGGRDQWLIARWAEALGRSAKLLAASIACAAASAAAMAWIGAGMAAILPPRAAQMLVAFALAVAAAELAWPVRSPPAPAEPTRSLAAFALVLLARQIGDAARFAILALAAWTVWPLTAGLGGALGGAAAAALGWSATPAMLARWPLRTLRIALAAGLALAALFIGLDARFGVF